jgi:hypothetical protein
MQKITITLSDKSIGRAIKELERYKRWVEEKTKLLCERLALIGAHEASVRFASAMYDGDNDVHVEVGPTENGWVIKAKGQAVCFIEFGAGVYHNPSEPYPNPRPAGIVGIGEYGKGKGKRQAWGYYDEAGNLVITRGNPATMPMWFATEEMRREVARIAKEVFKS